MACEASRSVRSRIADIDEERAQSIRMATLGERTRIAREIHDNVGHLLTRAIMQAQAGRPWPRRPMTRSRPWIHHAGRDLGRCDDDGAPLGT